MRPIVLDTDVGTDVDDAFAIALAAKSPELNLKAVTTVYGDVHLRARMARKLLRLLGAADVPVAAGIDQPLTPGKQVYWGGWEGEGFLTDEDESWPPESRGGVELILEVLDTSPDPVTLVAIGPLTNIAAPETSGRSYAWRAPWFPVMKSGMSSATRRLLVSCSSRAFR